MPNPVAFFEIVGPDGPALQRFYATVFGWSVDTTRVPGYGYLDSGEPGSLPGGIRQETAAPAERVLYLRVPDLGAARPRRPRHAVHRDPHVFRWGHRYRDRLLHGGSAL